MDNAQTNANSSAGVRRSNSANEKLDGIRDWSINTYKCTKQVLLEKLGKTSRTVNSDLERDIQLVRETQKRHLALLTSVQSMTAHFSAIVVSQRTLGDLFLEMAPSSPALREGLETNACDQQTLCRNGEHLLAALNSFSNSLSTLCNKTMEDTIITIQNYEKSRVEYDAYKADLNSLSGRLSPAKMQEVQKKFETHKVKYERLSEDVAVKIKLLEENRARVMQKQLLLFHNAISAYFSGNQQALTNTLNQFSIRVDDSHR